MTAFLMIFCAIAHRCIGIHQGRTRKKGENAALSGTFKLVFIRLCRILNNSNFPSAKTLDAICRALEITEKELFAGFSTYKLSAQEFILLKCFRQLPDFKKIALLQFLSSENNLPHK